MAKKINRSLIDEEVGETIYISGSAEVLAFAEAECRRYGYGTRHLDVTGTPCLGITYPVEMYLLLRQAASAMTVNIHDLLIKMFEEKYRASRNPNA